MQAFDESKEHAHTSVLLLFAYGHRRSVLTGSQVMHTVTVLTFDCSCSRYGLYRGGHAEEGPVALGIFRNSLYSVGDPSVFCCLLFEM